MSIDSYRSWLHDILTRGTDRSVRSCGFEAVLVRITRYEGLFSLQGGVSSEVEAAFA